MTKTFEQLRDESNAQVVATVFGKPRTRGELNAAFDLVSNKAHWKLPIEAIVHADDELLAVIQEAIVFFTGSIPQVYHRTNREYRIIAAGYFATIGT